MTRAQIETAVYNQRLFPRAKIIFSTGDTQGLGLPDSSVMARYALEIGLSQEAVIEEDQSTNSYENLLYSRRLVTAHGFQQPVLVLI